MHVEFHLQFGHNNPYSLNYSEQATLLILSSTLVRAELKFKQAPCLNKGRNILVIS